MLFGSACADGVPRGDSDVRHSIAITKALLKMSELDDATRRGDLEVDGVVVLRSRPGLNTDG